VDYAGVGEPTTQLTATFGRNGTDRSVPYIAWWFSLVWVSQLALRTHQGVSLQVYTYTISIPSSYSLINVFFLVLVIISI